MKNLITRSITGLIFVSLIIGSLIYGPYSFVGLYAIITGLLLGEFYKLMKAHQGVNLNTTLNVTGGVVMFLATSAYAMNLTGPQIFVAYLAYLLALLVGELYGKHPEPIKNIAYAILGQIYIALPFSLLNILGFGSGTGYNFILLLALFIFIWTNDTGAYVVGSMIGKRRLFERISPKKSWEGFFGGVAFVIGAACIFAHFSEALSVWQWIAMGIITSAFSTWGDLSESLIKRTIGVKDSGNMLPGHGGFLDRFDSVLLAAPAIVVYLGILEIIKSI